MADELELRRELDALARKRAALDAPSASHRGSGSSAVSGGSVGGGNRGRKSVLARLGAGNESSDSPRGAARTVSKENAFDDNQQRGSGGNKRGNGDRFSAATKRQRLHSAVSKPTDERDGRVEDPEDVSERKKRAVAPFAQKDTMARSRRMFGALMGHLGKAKAQIERDSDLFKRQDSKQHEAEMKEKIQSKTLEEKAKRDAAVQRLEKLIAKTEVDMPEQLARLKLEHLQKTRKNASLSGFLQTVASPPIFYLPVKHTKETEDLVAASKEAHKEKLQISTREHETRLRELEAEFTAKLEKLREELEEAKREEAEKAKNKDIVFSLPPALLEVKVASDVGESVPVEDAALEEEEADSAEQVVAGDGEVAMDEVGEESARTDESPEDNEEQDGDNMNAASNAMGDDAAAHSSGETLPESTVQHSEESKKTPPMREETAASAAAEDGDETQREEEDGSKSTDGETARHDSEQASAATSNDAVADKKNVGVKGSDDHTTYQEPKLESSEPEAASVPEKQEIDVSALKVTELREELKKRGLETKGLKASLVARLEEAMTQDGG